ncbi:MAG: hypothetical protein HZA36_00630 [Parcubacteria group bacterium]|nr:hypothetical protein [Parcubacteria group bacterium]
MCLTTEQILVGIRDSERRRAENSQTPKDDENTMYISGEMSFQYLLDRIQEKWPGVSFEDIEISSEYTHVYCIGYDLYDPSDYINYTVIRRIVRS